MELIGFVKRGMDVLKFFLGLMTPYGFLGVKAAEERDFQSRRDIEYGSSASFPSVHNYENVRGHIPQYCKFYWC